MSNHTPGPWHTEQVGRDNGYPSYRIVATDNSLPNLATIRGRPDSTSLARLFAAAPKLLEVLGWIETYAQKQCDRDSEEALLWAYVTSEARAALALVEGEEKL